MESLSKFVENRDKYENLAFFGGGGSIDSRIKLFYRCSMEMPEVVCDNNPDNYDLCIDGVVPIMSFDDALEKFDNLYVVITSDIYLNEIMEQVCKKIPMDRVFYFTPDEIAKYIKDKDYSKCEFSMPKHMKKIQDKLEYYIDLYEKGENIKIRTDGFFVKSEDKYVYLVDYMNQTERESYFVNYLNEKIRYKVNLIKKGKERIFIQNPICNNDDNYIENSIKNIVGFNTYLEAKHIKFAYIQVSCPISALKGDDYVKYYNDINFEADKLIKGLDGCNINNFDFRKYIIDNNIDTSEWFFKADPHWKPTTAFKTNQIICEYISSIINFDLNDTMLDINNYNIKDYKNIYLSDYGANLGLLYSGCDDFQMITPKFKTDFSWICEEKKYYKQGEAKDVLVMQEHLNGAYYNIHMRSAYSIIHEFYTIIKNNLVKNNKKIFIINDSFGRQISMFITQQFEEVHFFDFRQKDFNKKLYKAIEEVKPDIVLMMYFPKHLLSEFNPFNVAPQNNN